VSRGASEDAEFRRKTVGCLDGLFGFALALSRDRAVAEDLVQEACLRALRAARRPLDSEDVRPWLFTILHNVWRNERRRRVAEPLDDMPEVLETAVAVQSSAEEDLDRGAAADGIRRAIEALPETYREVVALRFGEGFSYQQIAVTLDCPAGTVMSRLARARALIRKAMLESRLPRAVGGRP
jgi:RNA polymerase sigma-70 factor (ECF subfamily)